MEGPAAVVEGPAEVRGAFRAGQAVSPGAAEPSTVERIGDDRYVVRTATRYLLPLSGPEGVTVRSEGVVEWKERPQRACFGSFSGSTNSNWRCACSPAAAEWHLAALNQFVSDGNSFGL